MIARQPIVNERGSLFAYDLLSLVQGFDTQVTSTLINAMQSSIGFDKAVGKRLGFVRVDKTFVMHDLLDLIPKDRVIYSILDTEFDDDFVYRLKQLKSMGYRLGINDCFVDAMVIKKLERVFNYIEFIKIDISKSRHLRRDDILHIKSFGIKVIASKIDSHDIHAECVSNGFDYYQGFFISKPKAIENAPLTIDHDSAVMLWNLLRTEATTQKLAEAFELNHLISLKLIRFVNSAMFALKNSVSSMRHVITLLGRDTLSRWLMLLMFSESEQNNTNSAPLLLMVVNRTELMVELLALIKPNASKQEQSSVYFVGMLSLIHLLFNIPHRQALKSLNVAPEIERALFEGDGFYGDLLQAVRSIEMADMAGLEGFLSKYSITKEQIETLIATAMEKVNQFDEMMS